jgi:hypothetical protein
VAIGLTPYAIAYKDIDSTTDTANHTNVTSGNQFDLLAVIGVTNPICPKTAEQIETL